MTFAKTFALIVATWLLTIPGQVFAESDQVEGVDPAAFMHSMAGEWKLTAEAIMGPGQDPMRVEGRAQARRLGRQWLVAESSGEVGGHPYTWIFTLGYIPHAEEFVATFVDSRQSHLWTYAGTLDEAGEAITLNTEGPVMGNPETMGQFRTIVEILDDDHWATRDSILGPDGEWFEFLRMDFRRNN